VKTLDGIERLTVSPRHQDTFQELPRRDVLQTLVHQYHHLQNEHQRTKPGSGVGRRIEERLEEVRERFDRLLTEWVPDPELQEAWREHLQNRAPAPTEPPAIRPIAFRGRSDAGSIVEIREGKGDDEFTVEINGSLTERIAAEKDFRSGPAFHFRLEGNEYEETFDASREALEALAAYLATDEASPPWEYASELLEDGLIDTHASLTPRGRRALARLS
jgi:hypothetical protein